MKQIAILLCVLMMLASVRAEPLRVASFNPVVSDLVRQVGGSQVEMAELLAPGANPHEYRLSPGDLKEARNADLVVLAGKGLELWADDLEAALDGQVPILEVGRRVPSLQLSKHDEMFACCPNHAHGAIDPHWWHSIRNAQRAVRIIEQALAEQDPEHAEAYRANADAYLKELDELYNWARLELSRVPKSRRKLVTAHAAFNYFCREFGFEAIPVQGLSTEQEPDPNHLKEVVKTLKSEHVTAVFPEVAANPKVLSNMVREAGVVVGERLLAGSPPVENPTYEAMVRHNVKAITAALVPE